MVRHQAGTMMGATGHDKGRLVWIYRGAAWVLVSAALAIAAPYGTEMPVGFWDRLGYWTSVNALAILIASYVRHVVLRRFRTETLGVLTGIAVLQAMVLGPVVWLVSNHVFGFALHGAVWLAEMTLIILLVSLCVALVRYEIARLRNFVGAEAGSVGIGKATGVARPEFLLQGDPALEGEVLIVSADDHYLNVVTTKGQGRVLMRFRDALSDLEQVPGYRIHRSHWVARSELLRVRPDGRRHVADLRSGKVLPVSDAYLDGLRDAGLMGECGIGSRIGAGPTSSISASAAIRSASSGRSQDRPPV